MITAMQKSKVTTAAELFTVCDALGKMRSRICWSPEQVRQLDDANVRLMELLETILPSKAPSKKGSK